MRPLALLPLAAVALAASVQRRQGHVITLDTPVTSGSLCRPDAVGLTVGLSGDAVEVSPRESRLDTPLGPASGDCGVEVSMTYPPGCTRALIDITVHAFLEGFEGITGHVDIAASLSTGGGIAGSLVYRNDEGVALETGRQVYVGGYPMDASAEVGGEEAAEVVLTVRVDSRVESADGTGGELTLDGVTVALNASSLDATGESCV